MFIDRLAYKSNLRHIHPVIKCVWVLICIIICISADNVIINMTVLITMLYMMIKVSKTPYKEVIKLLILPLSFIILGTIALLFDITTQQGKLLIEIPIGAYYLGINKDSIWFCINLVAKCMASISCMYFLSVTTPMLELFYVLRKSLIPNFIVEIMELTYRYIFVFYDVAHKIYIAQSSRLGYDNFKVSYHSTGTLIANLFSRSYQQASRTYIALESRGYTGEIQTIGTIYQTKKIYYWYVGAYTIFLLSLWILCYIRG